MFTIEQDVSIQLLCIERDKLDKEISKFRVSVLQPTKEEHRLFIKMKADRKKLQHQIKSYKRKERREREKTLHESLGVMTKEELKEWRVISHKVENIKQSLIQIQSLISKVEHDSKFQNLSKSLRDVTNTFYDHFLVYYKLVYDIENVITLQFYRDKKVVEDHKNGNV